MSTRTAATWSITRAWGNSFGGAPPAWLPASKLAVCAAPRAAVQLRLELCSPRRSKLSVAERVFLGPVRLLVPEEPDLAPFRTSVRAVPPASKPKYVRPLSMTTLRPFSLVLCNPQSPSIQGKMPKVIIGVTGQDSPHLQVNMNFPLCPSRASLAPCMCSIAACNSQ